MSEHKKEENKVGVLKPLTQPKPSGKKGKRHEESYHEDGGRVTEKTRN